VNYSKDMILFLKNCQGLSKYDFSERGYRIWFKEFRESFRSCFDDSKTNCIQYLDEEDLRAIYRANIPNISIIAFMVALENKVWLGYEQEGVSYESYWNRKLNSNSDNSYKFWSTIVLCIKRLKKNLF